MGLPPSPGAAVKRVLRALLLCCLAAAPLQADSRFVIVCGLGGEPEYERLFADWGGRLRRALLDFGHAPGRVDLLNGGAPATAAQVEAAIERAGGEPAPGALFVFLLGHGSYRDGRAKLVLEGPDLEAGRLAALLEGTPTAAVINGASSSAPFINALSGPGRLLCTATKSAEERNAPVFMEHFIRGLEDGSADLDGDERISLREACAQGAALTAGYFAGEGLVATEHALYDGDGDGLGTRPAEAAAGAPAYLRDWSPPGGTPAAWVEEYRQALDQVRGWIARKGEVEAEAYVRELERLLVRAARLNLRLRREAVE